MLNTTTTTQTTTLDLVNVQGAFESLATALDEMATVAMMIAKGDVKPHQINALASVLTDSIWSWQAFADDEAKCVGKWIEQGAGNDK